MSWLDRVATNLLPVSDEQENVIEALKEWYYTGDCYDLEEPAADCELCDHPNIRYQFVIRNDGTGHELLVGSECITRFGLTAIDESGRKLNAEQAGQKVRKDRNKLITDARKRRVIAVLVKLGSLDAAFDFDSLIDYLQERGAFTPSQLSLILWRLGKHGVEHQKADFKMVIKRKREQEQLLSMEKWKVQKLWPCMSSSQQDFFIENCRYEFP